jgi:catechol 2,3-dioxygenase-like lactoylglutathione lyase family enzyme/extradiol dioxygenase family protein
LAETSNQIRALRIIHSIHAVRDIDICRRQYQDVLGAMVFNEGYEPTADRDHALLYVTDHMIEPMAPRHPDISDKGFAKWLARFGEGWHSFEIKVENAKAAADILEAADCALLKSPYPVFFFVRPQATGGIFVEFCEVPMKNDPHDRHNWNPAWGEGLPSGLKRLDHIACVVRDLSPALRFFTELVDGEILFDEHVDGPQSGRRVMIRIGDTNVAITAPDAPDDGDLGAFLGGPNNGIYALVWQVEDEKRARANFESQGLGILTKGCVSGGFAINPGDFGNARHEFIAQQKD